MQFLDAHLKPVPLSAGLKIAALMLVASAIALAMVSAFDLRPNLAAGIDLVWPFFIGGFVGALAAEAGLGPLRAPRAFAVVVVAALACMVLVGLAFSPPGQ